jgi:hypothetical protein|tara:strand:+ start:240 stop:437 length:198 start_codon:yes stop_codon:yes gene_type:complete
MAKVARKTRAGKVIGIGDKDDPSATIEIIAVQGQSVSIVYTGAEHFWIDDIPPVSTCQTTENPTQ